MPKKTRQSAAAVSSVKPYASTSELVKTRPRKRGAPSSSPVRSSLPPEPSNNIDLKPQVYRPMALAHLDELTIIWDADKRTPSVNSRRTWALARNLKPEHVHRWWHRRKQVARKARITIPKGTYELPVGTPPVIEQVVKEEPRFSEPPNKLLAYTLKDDSDSASTILDTTNPSSDGYAFASSSDTAVTSPNCEHSPLDDKIRAYSSPIPHQTLHLDSQMLYEHTEIPTCALNSFPLPPSSPPSSASPELCTSRCATPNKLSKIAQPSSETCNQGHDDLSCFTCPMCTRPATASGILERRSVLALCWETKNQLITCRFNSRFNLHRSNLGLPRALFPGIMHGTISSTIRRNFRPSHGTFGYPFPFTFISTIKLLTASRHTYRHFCAHL
jgi:hypothetical protein